MSVGFTWDYWSYMNLLTKLNSILLHNTLFGAVSEIYISGRVTHVHVGSIRLCHHTGRWQLRFYELITNKWLFSNAGSSRGSQHPNEFVWDQILQKHPCITFELCMFEPKLQTKRCFVSETLRSFYSLYYFICWHRTVCCAIDYTCMFLQCKGFMLSKKKKRYNHGFTETEAFLWHGNV